MQGRGLVRVFDYLGEPSALVRSCAGLSIRNIAYWPGTKSLYIGESASAEESVGNTKCVIQGGFRAHELDLAGQFLFGYFQHATPGGFRVIDGLVRRRLRAILRKQEKRPGFGRCKADHQRWPNAFFAGRGLFTLQTAYVQARHSR